MKDLFNFDRSTVISTKDKLDVKTARKNKKALLRQTKRDENFKTIIEDIVAWLPCSKATFLKCIFVFVK